MTQKFIKFKISSESLNDNNAFVVAFNFSDCLIEVQVRVTVPMHFQRTEHV